VWRDGSVHELGRAEIGDVDDAPSYTPRAPRAPRAPRVRSYHFDSDDMKNFHGMIAPGRGRLGVETRDLDADLGSYFGTDRGVLVLHVVDDTPASRAGIKAGDVILSVDGDPVHDTDDLRTALRKKDEGNVALRIRRKNAERTITAKLEDRKEMGMWESGDHDWLGDNGTKVFHFRGPNGDGHAWWNGDGFNMEGLSDEDRAQLKKDIDQLREDLKELRKEKGRDDDDDDDDNDD